MKEHMIQDEEGVINNPGWTGRDAAKLAQVPARTVQHWRQTSFFVPSLAVVKDGRSVPNRHYPSLKEEGLVFAYPHLSGHDLSTENAQWFYALGDVIALRIAHDLRTLGVPTDVVKAAARTLADITWRENHPETVFRWIVYTPPTFLKAAGFDPPAPEDALRYIHPNREHLVEEAHPDAIVYDALTTITETIARADDYLHKKNLTEDLRPAWV